MAMVLPTVGTLLTGEGALTVEAGRHITLGGAVVASDDVDGDLILKADADTDAVGDMTAYSTITNLGGSIDIYSSETTTYLHDDVTASVDIKLHNDTWAADDVELDAGQDVIVGDASAPHDTTLTGAGDLTVEADRHITLGGAVETAGYLSLQADDNLDNIGDLLARDSVTSGTWLEAYGDNITINGAAESGTDAAAADKHMYLLADRADDGTGDLLAKASVTSGGVLSARGNNITFEGLVSSADYMKLKADSTDDGSGDLMTQGLTSGAYIEAYGDNITINGAAESGTDAAAVDKNIYLKADSTDNGSGDLLAKQTVTSGGYLEAKGNNITFEGPVSSKAGMLLKADSTIDGSGDLLAKDSVTSGSWLSAYGNNITFEGAASSHGTMLLKADNLGDGSGDVLAKDSLTSGVQLEAYGNNITFEGPASSTSYMYLKADSTGDGTGSVDVHGLVAGGDIDIYAADNTINIHKSADPAAVTDVHSDQDIILWNKTVADDGVILDAGDDVVLAGGKSITGNGNLTLEAGDDILLGVANAAQHWLNPDIGSAGNVTANGDLILTAGDDIHAHGQLLTEADSGGNITATAVDDIHLYNTPTSADADGTLTLTADSDDGVGGYGGDLTVDGALYGNMSLSGVDVTVYGDVESDGILDVDADDEIVLQANVSSVGAMTMVAGSDIELNGSSGNTSSDSTISLSAGDEVIIGVPYSGGGNVTADGHMEIFAGDDWNDDVLVYGKLTTLEDSGGNINVTAGDDITIWGTDNGPVYESVEADGVLTMSSNTSGEGFLGGDLYIAGDTIAESMQLEAGAGGPPDYSPSHVRVDGLLQTTGGDMIIRAHHDVLLGGNVDSAGNLVLNADRHGDYGYPDPHVYGGDVEVEGTIVADGTIDMYGNNITLWDTVTSTDDMTITANTSPDYDYQTGDPVGDVFAHGTLTSTEGSIEISASDDTIYLGADVTAAVDVTLNNNTVFDDDDDQKVDAQSGMITAKGWLWKHSEWGSLYLEAAGDISLADEVVADWGGVSIISE
ncbi:MAG: beta strand repeat-containing protein, partial [Planctomycetota bacterium]